MSEVLVSYSQNGEDIRLMRVFEHRASGFYVDVGAGGPVEDSVTKLFYYRGWSGINIEPGPEFVNLDASRPRDVNLRIAVSSDETQREFRVSKSHPGLSTFYPTESRERLPDGFSFESELVQCRTLQHILDEHGQGCQIDFMKIDVEGTEADVLRSLDLIATRPTVLLVEAVTPLTFVPNHSTWESIVTDAGYLLAAFDGINRFYVPSDQEELVERLAYPLCPPIDGYVPYRLLALERVLAETRASLERERSRSVALREVYAVRRWSRRVVGSIRRRLTL